MVFLHGGLVDIDCANYSYQPSHALIVVVLGVLDCSRHCSGYYTPSFLSKVVERCCVVTTYIGQSVVEKMKMKNEDLRSIVHVVGVPGVVPSRIGGGKKWKPNFKY